MQLFLAIRLPDVLFMQSRPWLAIKPSGADVEKGETHEPIIVCWIPKKGS